MKRIPKMTHHRARNQAVVRLAGRDIYLGPWGSKEAKTAYQRALAEHLDAHLAGKTAVDRVAAVPATMPTPVVQAAGSTIAELVAGYLQHAEIHYRKDGQETSEVDALRSACRPLLALYADTPVVEFDAERLGIVRERMIESGWVRTSINKQVNRLRRVFGWGVLKKMVPAWMPEALKPQVLPSLERDRCLARESEPVEGVTKTDVQAVLPHLSRQLAAVVEVQMLTGMRPGEVLRMRVRDIHFEGRNGTWVYWPQRHKNEHRGHGRAVPIGPRAQTVLRQWIKPDLDAWLFDAGAAERERCEERRQTRKTPRYPSHVATQARKRAKSVVDPFAPRPYTREAYARAIARACKKASVPHWHPHQLRHARGEQVRDETGDLQAVADALGHRDLKSALRYAPSGLKQACEIAAALG